MTLTGSGLLQPFAFASGGQNVGDSSAREPSGMIEIGAAQFGTSVVETVRSATPTIETGVCGPPLAQVVEPTTIACWSPGKNSRSTGCVPTADVTPRMSPFCGSIANTRS